MRKQTLSAFLALALLAPVLAAAQSNDAAVTSALNGTMGPAEPGAASNPMRGAGVRNSREVVRNSREVDRYVSESSLGLLPETRPLNAWGEVSALSPQEERDQELRLQNLRGSAPNPIRVSRR
jgi:hypothetical protein